jgi:hypothetical protein
MSVAMYGADTLRAGPLLKRSDHLGAWNPRVYVLRPGSLDYYVPGAPPSSPPRGSSPLMDVVRVAPWSGSGKGGVAGAVGRDDARCVFVVVARDGPAVLRAPDEATAGAWAAAIVGAAEAARSRCYGLGRDYTRVFAAVREGARAMDRAAEGMAGGALATLAREGVERYDADVRWEDDAAVGACPHCARAFSRFALGGGPRRHHCRVCGRVVCGECSAGTQPVGQRPGRGCGVAFRVRSCVRCDGVLGAAAARDARAAAVAAALDSNAAAAVSRDILRTRDAAALAAARTDAMLAAPRRRGGGGGGGGDEGGFSAEEMVGQRDQLQALISRLRTDLPLRCVCGMWFGLCYWGVRVCFVAHAGSVTWRSHRLQAPGVSWQDAVRTGGVQEHEALTVSHIR